MSISVKELSKSRRVGLAKCERSYVINGAADEVSALAALLTDPAVPTTIDEWTRINSECDVEEADDNIYVGRAAFYSSGGFQAVGSFSINFDISGQSIHVSHSKKTVHSYTASGEVARDFKQAINVSGTGLDMKADGVDIYVPAMTFTLDYVVSPNDVNDAYIGTLNQLVGKVNDAPFKSFAAGELLFTRVSGQRKDRDSWNLTFGFAASRNRTDLVVGSMTGIVKNGWDYLWAYYIQDKSGTTPTLKPTNAYVEQLYEPDNYNLLGLP